MTQTIGTYPIDIVPSSFREFRSAFGFNWPRWSATGYKREYMAYGWVGGWSFIAKEDANATPWTSSVAYVLYGYVASGGTLGLNVSIDTRHATPTDQAVYVDSVEVWYEDAMNTRYYRVSVSAV